MTDDARTVLAALRAMLDGGPAVDADVAGRVPADATGTAAGGPTGAAGGAAGTAADIAAGGVPAGTAAVITTSGSTGVPKRVVLSRAALDASADATAARIGAGAWLLALPASYVAGLQVLHRSLRAGHEPRLLSGRFTVQEFAAAARAMPRGIPAYTSLVPAQLARVLRETPDALTVFRAVLVGGQALPEPLRRAARDAGARIVRTYGATETCGGCVYDGVPLDGVRVRIVDGEVWLSGPMLADGYLGEPHRTAGVFVAAEGARWYRTGDIGEWDDGVLRVTGRRDNVIVSGGINVSLDRVEHIVRAVPTLERCAVVGVADERWGQASVVLVPGRVADGAALLRAARAAVAAAVGPHARPAHLFEIDAPVLLPSGKPDRPRLRALAAALVAAAPRPFTDDSRRARPAPSDENRP